MEDQIPEVSKGIKGNRRNNIIFVILEIITYGIKKKWYQEAFSFQFPTWTSVSKFQEFNFPLTYRRF